jgi:hypothetical protein
VIVIVADLFLTIWKTGSALVFDNPFKPIG